MENDIDLSNKILSDITIFLKYSRYIPELERRETWDELVTRNKQMHQKKYPKLHEEIEQVYKFVYERKILPSMRSLQFAGKSIELSPNRIYNCCFVPIDDYRCFGEIMFLLLGGTGVGYSVQYHHVDKLPEIRKPNKNRKKRFLIGDSIEGWADAIKALMSSYFKGTSELEFDFGDIRPKGARLITSGGKAPGPRPLNECLIKIKGILDNKQDGDKLTPLEVHDIVCYIADAVLAGGIRRAALISLFSADDQEMISCKTGNWYELNPQRGRANNSAVLLRHKISKSFFLDLWKRIEASRAGEPGIFFTNDKDWGTNPCLTADSVLDIKLGNDELKMSMIDVVCLVTDGADVLVKSYDIKSNKILYKKITAAALTKKDAKILRITDSVSGKTIKCTPDHKIYTKNRGWVEAKDLLSNDELIFDN